jgi:hypothetical protein
MGRRGGFFAQVSRNIAKAERAQRRLQRELVTRARNNQRLQTAMTREAEQQAAELEVETFQNQVELLVSVHRDANEIVDWAQAAAAPPPEPRVVDTSLADKAQTTLERYTPGFFAKVLKRAEAQRAQLKAALDAALIEVDRQREAARQADKEALVAWQDQVAFAKRVLDHDHAAYDQVITDSDCFDELQELGCALTVVWLSPTSARVALRAQESDVVPAEEKSITARGKLSAKKMNTTRSMEIYQDFICGAALRATRELLAVLPLYGVLVDVWTRFLNTRTGHEEDTVVLSVFCTREKFKRVNFEKVDASDFIGTLLHSMKFSKTKGLAPTEPLDITSIVETGPTS